MVRLVFPAVAMALVACGARTAPGAGAEDADVTPDAMTDAPTSSDLVLWLAGPVAVTSSSLVWLDQTANHHDATQSSPSQRPTPDGNGGLVFDGVDDHLALAPGFEDFTRGMTAFVVARPAHTSPLHAPRFFDFARSYGTLADSILFVRFGAGDELFYQTYRGSTVGDFVDAQGAVHDGQWQVFSVVASGGAPASLVTSTLYVNGALVASGKANVPTVVTRSSNFIARSNLGGIDTYLKGTLHEIRIYRGQLGAAERGAIDAELRKSVGL